MVDAPRYVYSSLIRICTDSQDERKNVLMVLQNYEVEQPTLPISSLNSELFRPSDSSSEKPPRNVTV
jgi:hypothetical protein